jgi:hypothetical protein
MVHDSVPAEHVRFIGPNNPANHAVQSPLTAAKAPTLLMNLVARGSSS